MEDKGSGYALRVYWHDACPNEGLITPKNNLAFPSRKKNFQTPNSGFQPQGE